MKRFCFLIAFLAMGQGMFAATEKVMSTRATVDTNSFFAFQPSNTTLQALLEWLDTNWYSLTNKMATKSDLQQYVNDMEQRFLTITNFDAYIASLSAQVTFTGRTIAITSAGTTNIAIPAGATKLTFYCWGGGGGGRGGGHSTQGGGGGFAFGSVGTTNSIASTTAGYVWTGATIRVVTAAGGEAGYGGGYTRISVVTNSYERHCLVAGGGGGGGYVDPEADNYPGQFGGSWQWAENGGGGGGTNGGHGGSTGKSGIRFYTNYWNLVAAGGGGGSQSEAGGFGVGDASVTYLSEYFYGGHSGLPGDSYTGGVGGSMPDVYGGHPDLFGSGGRGGAGYKGGGGGGAAAIGWRDTVFQNVAAGGGGGSGYINTSIVTDGYLSAASGRNPPKTDLWAYAAYSGGNRAVGGVAASGYPGLVVIIVE